MVNLDLAVGKLRVRAFRLSWIIGSGWNGPWRSLCEFERKEEECSSRWRTRRGRRVLYAEESEYVRE